MKEYIAETGGRYTYTDDFLNLQELALSFSAIFDGCSNFIIAGCEINGNGITPGFVWINGKVRRFEGTANAGFPYFIYEKNSIDTTSYANEVNKRGRYNYQCVGATSVPAQQDAVTHALPGFIEMTKAYSPRFIDKFFGKYGVLLDSPFSKQTVKKDLALAGKFTADKDIESKTAVSVISEANGYCIKNIVKASGDGSVGVYLNGLLVNEIVLNTNGSFSFMKQGKELARITDAGMYYSNTSASTGQTGSILIYDSHLINNDDATDDGAIHVNHAGYQKGGTKYRNFNVYNGKSGSVPLFQVNGKSDQAQVNGLFNVANNGRGINLTNKTYLKTDKQLINAINWTDSSNDVIASVGFVSVDSFDFAVDNTLGNVVVKTKGYLDVIGDLKVNGVSLATTYVTKTSFTAELQKKVNVVTGKQLSTEDFTTDYKEKLDSISKGNLGSSGDGFATAKDITEALGKKLNAADNLADLSNKGTARTNLGVYSKDEANSAFLKISGNLLELVTLTVDEVNWMTTEQITARKAEKQATVRKNIDAEKLGTGDLKLAKASNLLDLTDKVQARKNISVYSTSEIDAMLSGKLSVDSNYTGAIFTPEHKSKLEAIKTGNFAGVDNEGKSISQTEGYVMTNAVVKELAKKANLLLDGYNDSQKATIAANINVYSKSGADGKFAALSNIFQDYITYLVSQGKSTSEAQKTLRDKLDVLSKSEVSSTYLRNDNRLVDLILTTEDHKKQACGKLGAAYAADYQTRLMDTGWLQMSNSGGLTDTQSLFVRQIGNMVCIQGTLNTAKRNGSYWGGVVAVIPNLISPPKYGLRKSYMDFNDDTKYNRGASFVIKGNSRNILIYESGWYNVVTEIDFAYMT